MRKSPVKDAGCTHVRAYREFRYHEGMVFLTWWCMKTQQQISSSGISVSWPAPHCCTSRHVLVAQEEGCAWVSAHFPVCTLCRERDLRCCGVSAGF